MNDFPSMTWYPAQGPTRPPHGALASDGWLPVPPPLPRYSTSAGAYAYGAPPPLPEPQLWPTMTARSDVPAGYAHPSDGVSAAPRWSDAATDSVTPALPLPLAAGWPAAGGGGARHLLHAPPLSADARPPWSWPPCEPSMELRSTSYPSPLLGPRGERPPFTGEGMTGWGPASLRAAGVDALARGNDSDSDDDDDDDDDAAGDAVLRDHIRHSAQHMHSARRSAAVTLSAHKRRVHGFPLTPTPTAAPTWASAAAAPVGPSPRSSSGLSRGAAFLTTSPTTHSTAAAEDDEDCCIAAVVHNGAKEVGVALVTLPALALSLTQFGDTATYTKLLSLLHSRNPVEVVLASTTLQEPVTNILLDHFRDEVTFTSVPRRHFASERGVVRLNRLKSSQEMTPSIEDTDRYLCMAAANALILYVESIMDLPFMPGSVRVRWVSLDDFADLPRSAARALHIICPSSGYTGSLRPASRAGWGAGGVAVKGSGPSNPAALSGLRARLETVPLVDAMPRACTPVGQRLLRSSLLQPLKNLSAIEDRLDAVEWLMADPASRLSGLRRRLLPLSGGLDMERMALVISYSESLRPLQAAPLDVYTLDTADAQAAQPLGNRSASAGGDGRGADGVSRLQRPAYSLQEQEQQQQLAALYRERNERVIGCLMDYWVCVEVLHELEQTLARLLPTPELEAVAGPVAGSPTNPRLLRQLLASLQACDLTSMESALAHHLDRAAREERVVMTAGAQTLAPASTAYGASRSGSDSLTGTDARGLGGRRVRGGPPRPCARGSRVRQHQRLARMAFAVRSPPGSALDMARSRYSEQIRCITEYYTSLCAAHQMHSLRLEPDPATLFSLSYDAAEESKTVGGPFRHKFSGGNHFALHKRDLHARALQQRQQQQQQQQQTAAGGGPQPRWGTESLCLSEDLPHSDWPPADDDLDDDVESGEDGGPGSDAAPHTLRHSLSSGLGPAPCTRPPLSSASGGEGVVGATGQRRRRRARVRCTTDRLTALCQEACEYLNVIFAEEVAHASGLLHLLRSRLGSMQAMTEAVAMLDMLLSFAVYSFANDCTRPVLSEREGEGEGEGEGGERQASTRAGSRECGRRTAVDTGRSSTHHHRRSPAALFSWEGGADAASTLCTSSPSAAGDAGRLSDSASEGRPGGSFSSSSSPSREARAGMCAAPVGEAGPASVPGSRRGCVFMESARHPSQSPRQLAQLRGGGGGGPLLSARATANTMEWVDGAHVLLVTGPNATGKSTLLRIVGQLYTLAQCGCFLPCARAHLCIVDRILAHMLCDELPSPQYSSQSRELMELAEITHAATRRSLVLVDELGRSMTSREGCALAWATVEWLRSCAKSQTLFATHFPDLARIPETGAGVANAHFSLVCSTTIEGGAAAAAPQRTTMAVSHVLRPGPCTCVGYGLQAAAGLGFYPPVLALAGELRESYSRRFSWGPMTGRVGCARSEPASTSGSASDTQDSES